MAGPRQRVSTGLVEQGGGRGQDAGVAGVGFTPCLTVCCRSVGPSWGRPLSFLRALVRFRLPICALYRVTVRVRKLDVIQSTDASFAFGLDVIIRH